MQPPRVYLLNVVLALSDGFERSWHRVDSGVMFGMRCCLTDQECDWPPSNCLLDIVLTLSDGFSLNDIYSDSNGFERFWHPADFACHVQQAL